MLRYLYDESHSFDPSQTHLMAAPHQALHLALFTPESRFAADQNVPSSSPFWHTSYHHFLRSKEKERLIPGEPFLSKESERRTIDVGFGGGGRPCSGREISTTYTGRLQKAETQGKVQVSRGESLTAAASVRTPHKGSMDGEVAHPGTITFCMR